MPHAPRKTLYGKSVIPYTDVAVARLFDKTPRDFREVVFNLCSDALVHQITRVTTKSIYYRTHYDSGFTEGRHEIKGSPVYVLVPMGLFINSSVKDRKCQKQKKV